MQVIENNALFTEVSAEESATVSGGGPLSYLIYSLLSQTSASPGGVTATVGEIQDGWNILINAAPAVGSIFSL
ncbi:MAG: hypothetical protein HEQ35_21300 [Gloeotrichia echinulata IR180]|jgi:hypothetical protein|nr:hypothetical protein [Gloeotrichia echinulata DEX184]